MAHAKAERAAASGWKRLLCGWRLLRQANTVIRRIEGGREGNDAENGRARPLWHRLLFHSPRQRTLGFLVLPNATLAYSIGWMSLRFQIGGATRVGIRGLVEAYQRDITNLDGRSQLRATRTAAKLAQALGLYDLLRDIPGRIGHLTITPDDQLHGLPFAAIPLDAANPANYLGLRWTTSISVAGRPARSRKSRVRRALITGAARTDGYRPLPGVTSQCQTLALWASSRGIAPTVILDDQLTRTSLFHALPGASLFHFSGHAVLRPDAPESSGLVLPKTESGEQLVRLADLVSRPLSGLAHATLAACWAADGYVFPGGHSVSFPQLIAKAGAGSILAPLWEVDDSVTAWFLGSLL